MTLWFLVSYFQQAQGLIRVQVNQRTELLSYDDEYADLHAYFDVGYD